jgi:hypothetical protein
MLYTDDYRRYFLEEASQRKQPKLESITSIVKKEAKKHGKKSREYQLIVEMQNKYSEVGIYTALALARTTFGSGWAIDEILGELEDKPFIDKKYHKLLEVGGDKGMSEAEKKEKAVVIWKEITEKEHEQIAATGKFLSRFRAPKPEDKQEEILEQIIDGIANELEELSVSDPYQTFAEIEKASKKAIERNPEIVEYILSENGISAEDDEHAEAAAITELGSLVAKNLRVRSTHLGRRKSAWEKV